jgi:hypothetical protein
LAGRWLPWCWGNADVWEELYAPRYVLWCAARFAAYPTLIVWAYSHTGSLLLAQLQVFVTPT